MTEEELLSNQQSYKRFQNVPGYIALENIFARITQFKEQVVNGEEGILAAIDYIDERYRVLLEGIIPGYKSGDKVTQKQWLNISGNFRSFLADNLLQQESTVVGLLTAWKAAYSLKDKTAKEWRMSEMLNPTKVIEESRPFCNSTIPQCNQGEELRHGFYDDGKWQKSYGAHCDKCSQNMFKSTKGNAKCEHCPVNVISNDGRTFCFDPYTKIYLKLGDPVMISITAFS